MKTKWVLLTIVVADIVAMIVFFAYFSSCRTSPKTAGSGQACMECDVKTCQGNVAMLDQAVASLETAKKSLDAGDTKTATVDVDKAATVIKGVRDSMNANIMKMMPATSSSMGEKVINSRCPIMGGDVDPNNTPAELVVIFKGQKIGLCCGACPPIWNKLSDAEKEKKLAKVLTPTNAATAPTSGK